MPRGLMERRMAKVDIDEMLAISSALARSIAEAQLVRDEQEDGGFCDVKLYVGQDRIKLVLRVNGQEDIVAHAKINGGSYLDFVKSFSYAAHMCYKLAEQRELNDR